MILAAALLGCGSAAEAKPFLTDGAIKDAKFQVAVVIHILGECPKTSLTWNPAKSRLVLERCGGKKPAEKKLSKVENRELKELAKQLEILDATSCQPTPPNPEGEESWVVTLPQGTFVRSWRTDGAWHCPVKAWMYLAGPDFFAKLESHAEALRKTP